MALVNPNIALSYKPVEIPQQRNMLADAASAMQLQQAAMQMDKYQRDADSLERVRQASIANGGPDNLPGMISALKQSSVEGHLKMALDLEQKLAAKTRYEAYLREQGIDIPAAGATPAPANAMAAPGAALAMPTAPGAAPAPANAMVVPGAAPAPVNAMAVQTPQQIMNRIRLLSDIDYPGAKAEVDVLKAQLGEMQKKPTSIEEYEYGLKNPAFARYQRELKQAGANKNFMEVNTQLPASEEAQKEFMKEMRQTYSALKQAPTVLDNIEKAKALVPQAKGFMGAGGEGVLQAASFLNNRLGTSINTQGVKSAEELRSRLFLGIMDNLKKLDSQPSQQQQAALQQALGSIGTDPNALPRVLDVFGDTIRQKVDLYNEEASSAEGRGVKFPYKPTITLKPRAGAETGGAGASAGAGAVPAGVDPALWNVMTLQERALWRK